MTRRPTARLRIGDVIEIPTVKGLAYAQYTHKDPLHGSLLRVFPNFYPERPRDLHAVADQPPTLSIFFPLSAAVTRGTVAIVGNIPVAESLRGFPLFRVPMPNLVTGGVQKWWLWNGHKEWPVGELTPEQRQLPIREVWNDTLLLERIASGWTPQADAE